MNLLELDGDQVKVTPEVLRIKVFRGLWDRDRTKSKSRVMNELAFIWLYKNVDSPYVKQGLEHEEKVQAIKEDIGLPSTWEFDELMAACCEKYEELTYTQSFFLVEDAMKAVNKLRDYFTSINLLQLDDKGKPVYSAVQLVSALKQVGGVHKELKKLKEEVMKEMSDSGAIRGGEELGMFEDPNA